MLSRFFSYCFFFRTPLHPALRSLYLLRIFASTGHLCPAALSLRLSPATTCLALPVSLRHLASVYSPLSSGSFYAAFGVLAGVFAYISLKKSAEPEVFPIYKVVLDEEVRIGKRNSDYTINPTYTPKAPSATTDGF